MTNPEKIRALVDDLDEVLTNLAAVRGEPFANGVSIIFEVRQLVELLGILNSMAGDESTDVILAASHMIGSISRKALGTFSLAEIEEILKTGDSLFERRQKAMTNG